MGRTRPDDCWMHIRLMFRRAKQCGHSMGFERSRSRSGVGASPHITVFAASGVIWMSQTLPDLSSRCNSYAPLLLPDPLGADSLACGSRRGVLRGPLLSVLQVLFLKRCARHFSVDRRRGGFPLHAPSACGPRPLQRGGFASARGPPIAERGAVVAPCALVLGLPAAPQKAAHQRLL